MRVIVPCPHLSGSQWSVMHGRGPQSPSSWFIPFHVSGLGRLAPLMEGPQSRVGLPARTRYPFSPAPGPSPLRLGDRPVAAPFEQTTNAPCPWGHHVQMVQTR